jgi:hypothetical protein
MCRLRIRRREDSKERGMAKVYDILGDGLMGQ